MNYTIKAINTGFTQTSKGKYLYHHSVHKYYDVEGDAYLPVVVLLVQGNGRNILIDTGMSNTEIADKYHHPGSYQNEGQAVHEQLEEMGVSPDDIDTIIFTHLHWDHVYNMEKFKNAKLYVQRAEYEFAIDPIPLYYKSYEAPILGRKPPFHGAKFELLDGETEVLEGISVYPTPGHSSGHQNVTIQTTEGVYHFVGDLFFTTDALKEVPEMQYDVTPPGRFLNIVDSWNSIRELKKRVESKDKILGTHTFEMIDLIESGRVIGE